MSLSDFLNPINVDKLKPQSGFYNSHLGTKIIAYENEFPDIHSGYFDVAIIGVTDDRGAVNNQGCALAPDYIRAKLYSLNEGAYTAKIADLGNILPGFTLSDTYIALKTVVTELLKLDI